ncbi:hypothetical protein [Carboxylicivirga taeanensis]|uniref:hypothetical protein n=1 Tax=Carboxylicivirga taeanensis TaxID=1416875 RepID=UPI003F6DDC2F
MNSIEFENIKIYEINGYTRKSLNGEFTPLELSEKLVNEWIPYYECHKCGKGDYCKYTIPHPANPLRKRDIKCGVAIDALKNFVNKTIFVLDNASRSKKQKYLDAAFHFYKYVIESEQWNGSFIDNEKLDWWGKHAVKFYSEILPIRDTLNELGNCLKEFPELYEGTSLLLVEGESEKAFVENLRSDGEISKTWQFIVESYGGKGNKLPKRIKMLLDDYQKKGYLIYIQGDEDGNGDGTGFDKFKEYVNQSYIVKQNIFQFKYDFESSIPKKLLYHVLLDFGYLENVSFEKFRRVTEDRPMNSCLLKEFNIDTNIDNLKVRIAKAVGNAIFHIDFRILDQFYETELGAFVRFLEKIK